MIFALIALPIRNSKEISNKQVISQVVGPKFIQNSVWSDYRSEIERALYLTCAVKLGCL